MESDCKSRLIVEAKGRFKISNNKRVGLPDDALSEGELIARIILPCAFESSGEAGYLRGITILLAASSESLVIPNMEVCIIASELTLNTGSQFATTREEAVDLPVVLANRKIYFTEWIKAGDKFAFTRFDVCKVVRNLDSPTRARYLYAYLAICQSIDLNGEYEAFVSAEVEQW